MALGRGPFLTPLFSSRIKWARVDIRFKRIIALVLLFLETHCQRGSSRLAKAIDAMAAYNLGFAKQMNRAAELMTASGVREFDEAQAVAYMNLVAIEVAMKAILEKAGWDATYLRRKSHDLKGLLVDVCETEFLEEVSPNYSQYRSAAKICTSQVTDTNGAKGAVGAIIDSESRGASKYPNELRYGDNFSHFSPTVLTAAAKAVIDFAERYWDTFRKK